MCSLQIVVFLLQFSYVLEQLFLLCLYLLELRLQCRKFGSLLIQSRPQLFTFIVQPGIPLPEVPICLLCLFQRGLQLFFKRLRVLLKLLQLSLDILFSVR